MAHPVIEILRARRPDVQLAYTFFSPSAHAVTRQMPIDVADYLPFDTAAAARRLLRALRPSVLVFSKLDVWPLLAETAAAQGVPTVLISAAMGERSSRTSLPARLLLRDAYASLAAVGAASETDARNLCALGTRAERVIVTGDTRYDQVWARVTGPSANAALIGRLRTLRHTLVAGSTWSPDDRILLDAWDTVRKNVPDARLIIAAHEPHARQAALVREWARARALSCADVDAATTDSDVVIVNRTGVLADLYALATVAYVGGGFHSRGLHSVVEPAACGAPVLFGPRGIGARDADLLLAAGGAWVVRSASDMEERISRLMRDDATRSLAGNNARSVIAAGLGGAERSAALVLRLLGT